MKNKFAAAGSGSYKISIYENVSGSQYAAAMSQTISAAITKPYGSYLYPNQYVNFNSESKVVAKAAQLAEVCAADLDVATKDDLDYDTGLHLIELEDIE